MKNLLTLLLLAGMPPLALAAEADPVAVSMDLYPNGTRIIFELDAAENMTFQLPGAFDSSTIRVITPAGVSVNYFQKTSVPIGYTVPDSLKELHAAIKAKEAEVSTLAARVEAAKNSLTLITNNTREFERIPHLKIENWVS